MLQRVHESKLLRFLGAAGLVASLSHGGAGDVGEGDRPLEARRFAQGRPSRAGPKGLPRALRALGRRREHPSLRSGQVVEASADLQAVAAEIAEQVRLLDGP